MSATLGLQTPHAFACNGFLRDTRHRNSLVPWRITDRQAITAAKRSPTTVSYPTWLTLTLQVTETCQFRSMWSWGQIMWVSIMHIKRRGAHDRYQRPQSLRTLLTGPCPRSSIWASLLALGLVLPATTEKQRHDLKIPPKHSLRVCVVFFLQRSWVKLNLINCQALFTSNRYFQ